MGPAGENTKLTVCLWWYLGSLVHPSLQGFRSQTCIEWLREGVLQVQNMDLPKPNLEVRHVWGRFDEG